MTISLRLKIIGLVSAPLLISLFYGGLSLQSKWSLSKEARRVVEGAKLLEFNSELIHETQLERAKTALFLNDKLDLNELNLHREIVGKKMTAVTDQFALAELPPAATTTLEGIRNSLRDFRASVDKRAIAPTEAAKQITQIIGQMISLDVFISSTNSIEGTNMALLSLTMLELGKEYGGRFRVNLLNVLSANKPLSSLQLSMLESLKTGLIVNMDSPVLMISSEGRQKLNSFKESNDWEKVNSIYNHVLEKSSEGNFNQDPKEFFSAMTAALNSIGEIIKFEISKDRARIEALHEKTLHSFTVNLIIISILDLVLIALTSIMVRAISSALNSTVKSLSQASESISLNSSQVAKASNQVATGAVESASALEEVVASIEELNSIVAQNTLRAKQAAEFSGQGYSMVDSGKKEMDLLIQAMAGISESSKKIEEIINVIDDIAFQTNLLALNAAVEAARAGEQGKGFAVVAEAVRSLAQRSAVAAKDISSLIKESSNKIQEGVQKVTVTSSSLLKTVDTISKISSLNSEISNSSEEQVQGINQISTAINKLDTSTQQNASAAEEVSASSDQMNQQISTIGELVILLSNLVEGEL